MRVILILIIFFFTSFHRDDTPNWISSAVIYQITPYIFTDSCRYPDIEAKLPELHALGVNTLYFQPVFQTHRGNQGYDITNYFELRPDLGTERQLQSLIKKAKSLNMRVLFDMVLNHTSIHHPYALDVVKNGKQSKYYHYYQHDFDSALYSQHYHKDSLGFVYYFWKDLVNLNFSNEEVQRLMIDACKHWIKKFDIDGYRFDAVWAVNARAPDFGLRLRRELKKIKPGVLMLAEDKASHAKTYRQGFDVAYDWDKDIAWVSKWSWQYEYDNNHSHTIFNHPSVSKRKELLRAALFSDGDSIGPRLRFLENNDHHRFISNHSLKVTKMAATMLFTLNGVPMLFNGQETGFKIFPYRPVPIYSKDSGIRARNPKLFDFYRDLIRLRKTYQALTLGKMEEIAVENNGIIAFTREHKKERITVLMNLDSVDTRVTLSGVYKDLLIGGEYKQVVPVEGHSAKVLLEKLNRQRFGIFFNTP